MSAIAVEQVIRRMVGLRPYLEQITDAAEIIAENIESATARFERELEMCIPRSVIKQDPEVGEVEGVDYDLYEPALHWPRTPLAKLPKFRMRRRPVISVESVRMELGEQFPIFQFPAGWLRVQTNLGIVDVLPVPLGDLILSAEGAMVYQWVTGRTPWPVIPQFVKVNYTAGYEDPASDPRLRELRRQLANAAALETFRDLRDQIPSSVSIDGASQSFDAVERRLEAREEEIARFFDDWRDRHNPPVMVVV